MKITEKKGKRKSVTWQQVVCFVLGGILLLIAILLALPKNNKETLAKESLATVKEDAQAAILIECSSTGYGYEEALQVGGRLTVGLSPYTTDTKDIAQKILQHGMELALELPPSSETLLSVYGVMQEEVTPALGKTLLTDAQQIVTGARGILIPENTQLEQETLKSMKAALGKQQYFICRTSDDVDGSIKCDIVIDCSNYENATASVTSMLSWFAQNSKGLIVVQPGSQYKLKNVVSILQNEGISLVFVSALESK